MQEIKPLGLDVNEYGVTSAQEYIAKSITEKLLGIVPDGVLPLPTLEAVADNNTENLRTITFELKASKLMANKPERTKLLRIKSSSQCEFVKYVSNYADFGDNTFTIQDMNNNIYTGNMIPDDTYKLLVMIKEGGCCAPDGKAAHVAFGLLVLIGISAELARKIHNDALAVDTHNDVMVNTVESTTWLPMESIGSQLSTGNRHLDIPKMQEGGLDVAFFAAYTPGFTQPGRSNSRILALINSLHWNARINEKKFVVAVSSKEIEELSNERKVGVIAIEGAYSLEEYNYKGLLRQYFDLGVRMIALCWSNSNSLGEGVKNAYVDGTASSGGLTALGAKVIGEMERLGITIDVAHMNVKTFWDTIAVAKGPIVASHSCASAIHNVPRNLNDDQIRAIAKSSGVVQINFYPVFLGCDGRNGLNELVDHIDYVTQLVGVDYVGLGSDFDGATMPADIPSAAYYYRITEQLIDRGYTKAGIEKILGANIMRVFKEVETRADKTCKTARIDIAPDISPGDRVYSWTPYFTAKVSDNGIAVDVSGFKLFVDGIEYVPTFDPYTRILSLLIIQPLTEKFHVVTFEGASICGAITRETRIFYIDVPVPVIDMQVKLL
jgi:membrane dipeptidase